MATTSTTKGINVSGIEKIKIALNDYKKKVESSYELKAKQSIIQSAIKGTESEASLIAMYTQIDLQMENYLKQLDQYNQILDTMKDSYAKNDAGNTSFTDILKQQK
jgi:hypothetical protein